MVVATKKKIKKKIPTHPQNSSGKFISKKNKNEIELEEEMMEMDPRKVAFANAYLNPMSPTYANCRQSCLKVGFSVLYSEKLLANRPKWLSDIVGKSSRIDQALKNLDEDLKINVKVQAMGAFGPIFDKKTKKPVMVLNPKLIEKRQNASFFILERTHPEFKKKDKDELPPPVEIKQIVIIAPNGERVNYNSANAEAVTRVLGTPNE